MALGGGILATLPLPGIFSEGRETNTPPKWPPQFSGPPVARTRRRAVSRAYADQRVEAGVPLDYMRKPTEFAHFLWQQVLRPGDLAVDATCGNGHDALALARMVGLGDSPPDGGRLLGRVVALDIQAVALANAERLLQEGLGLGPHGAGGVELVQQCHSKLNELVDPESVRVVAFNLGYLPGGDKQIISGPSTTREGLLAALEVVQRGGLVSLITYVGHEGGREEHEAVVEVVAGLSAREWTAVHMDWANRQLSPKLFVLKKL